MHKRLSALMFLLYIVSTSCFVAKGQEQEPEQGLGLGLELEQELELEEGQKLEQEQTRFGLGASFNSNNVTLKDFYPNSGNGDNYFKTDFNEFSLNMAYDSHDLRASVDLNFKDYFNIRVDYRVFDNIFVATDYSFQGNQEISAQLNNTIDNSTNASSTDRYTPAINYINLGGKYYFTSSRGKLMIMAGLYGGIATMENGITTSYFEDDETNKKTKIVTSLDFKTKAIGTATYGAEYSLFKADRSPTVVVGGYMTHRLGGYNVTSETDIYEWNDENLVVDGNRTSSKGKMISTQITLYAKIAIFQNNL